MKENLHFHNKLTNIKLLIYIFLSISLLTVDNRTKFSEKVRYYTSTIVTPIYYLGGVPLDIYESIDDYFSTKEVLQKNNKILNQKIIVQSAKLQELTFLREQNERLKKLLDPSALMKLKRMTIAEIIRVDLNPYKNQIMINKGSEDKIYMGQVAIDEKGLLGQISFVEKNNSIITLISDPGHALLATNTRTKKRIVISGTGDNQELKGLYVPINADIKEGDLLLTSGLDDIFPEGHMVGKILTVEIEKGIDFSEIQITPAASLSGNKEVILLWE